MKPGPKTPRRLLTAVCIEPIIPVAHDKTLDTVLYLSLLTLQPEIPVVTNLCPLHERPRVGEVGIKPGKPIVRQRLQGTHNRHCALSQS